MFKRINKNRSFVARNITHKCLCIICTLLVVFSNAVPSHAVVATLGAITTAAEAGNTVGELFGMVLEDFFGLNHQCTLTEATLITINRSLDSIFSNTYGYDIVNPYSGSSGTYHRSGATFGQMLADMNNSIATLGTRYLGTLVTNSNGISQLVSDIKTNTTNSASADLALLTLMGDQVNIDWVALSDGNFVDSSLNVITSQTDVYSPYNYFFRFNFASNNNLGAIKVELPVFSNGRTARVFDFKFYDINGSGQYAELDMKYVYVYNINKQSLELYLTNFSYNYSDMLIQVVPNSGNYRVYPSRGMKSYYIQSTKEDYLKVADFMYLNSIDSKLDSLKYNDSNVVNAINDISLVDNDVKLTPVIDSNLPTNGTNIVDRLRMYFSTGVTVNQFFNAVDNAELGWYDQENSDVINTLSGGYVNLYE